MNIDFELSREELLLALDVLRKEVKRIDACLQPNYSVMNDYILLENTIIKYLSILQSHSKGYC